MYNVKVCNYNIKTIYFKTYQLEHNTLKTTQDYQIINDMKERSTVTKQMKASPTKDKRLSFSDCTTFLSSCFKVSFLNY